MAWYEVGDEVARTRALIQLRKEWRPRVARFVRDPELTEVWLQDALVELCVLGGGRVQSDDAAEAGRECPRVLAPTNQPAAAWRGSVLRNWLISRWRKHSREQMRVTGYEPQDLDRMLSAATQPKELTQSEQTRDRIRQALDGVPVKTRALLMLCYEFDITSLLPELSKALSEPQQSIERRLEKAQTDPTGRQGAFLTDAEIRVVYPDGDLRTRRDTARKAMRRALNALRGVLEDSQ